MSSQCSEIRTFIVAHFDVEKLRLDLLCDRITFTGKLKDGSELGTFMERGSTSDAMMKMSAYLRGDFSRFVMRKIMSVRENRLVAELHPAELEMKFYTINQEEIPLW